MLIPHDFIFMSRCHINLLILFPSLFLSVKANSNAPSSAAYETAINEVVVPILHRETCNEWLGCNGLNVTDGMTCAGYVVRSLSSPIVVVLVIC